MKIILPSEDSGAPQPAVIKVIGVGGGGSNAVNRMLAAGVSDVEFIAVNTDQQALRRSDVPTRIQIGEKFTKGLGVGGDPEKGKKAAEESSEDLRNNIKGADMIFITAGMGGGTGTGAAPVIAQIAKSENILVIGVVTKPFDFEGGIKMSIAEDGIKNIRNFTDALIIIPNEKVFNVVDNSMSESALYAIIDGVLKQSIQAVTDVITKHGQVNVDLADVRNVIKDAGTALIGIGESSGNVKEAMAKAMVSPLLDNHDISMAKKILVHFAASSELTALQFKEMADVIKGYNTSAHLKYGTRTDDRLDSKIKITIIATGFKEDSSQSKTEIGQASLFDDVNSSSDVDFSKPPYTYLKARKLK